MSTHTKLAMAARAALVVLPMSLALTGVAGGTAQAAPIPVGGHLAAATASVASRVVGTWSADVNTTVPSSGTVTYVFRPDGTMTLTAGTASVSGTWQAGRGDRFTFVIDNALTDSNGNVTGEAHAVQDSELHGKNAFTSTGTTVETDLAGNVITTFQVNITASRISS